MILFRWLLESTQVQLASQSEPPLFVIKEVELLDCCRRDGRHKSVGFLLGRVMGKAVAVYVKVVEKYGQLGRAWGWLLRSLRPSLEA